MKLYYKIDFNTTNSYFKHIIQDIIKKCEVNVVCRQYKGFILLIVDESEENIEYFFKELEVHLPLSIFLTGAKVIDEFDESQVELEDKHILQNLSLLTNQEITQIIEENKNIDFSNDINQIKAGNISRIETHNGFKDFFLPSKSLREELESKGHEVKLFVTNMAKLNQLVAVSQKDLQLLCSIERPLVKLKFNLLQNQESEYSNTNFIYTKIPDDKESLLFANALKNEGIDYLLYIKEDSLQDGLKVTYFEKNNIIVKGEKSLFPKYDYTLEKQYNSSKEYFDDNGGVYKATLVQANKRIKPSIGVYFSYGSEESAISVNIPGKGKKDIIEIPNIVLDFDHLMEEIEQIDENTQRLVQNYKKQYPETFKKDLELKESNGFESILNLTARMLGLSDFRALEASALSFNSKSGIQIDMKLVKIDNVNYLDYRRIVQSIMSYKMAGVENTMLAYSFYESLSEFISDNVNKIATDIQAKDVVLCGDMFANSILLSKVDKNLGKQYKVILPIEYPLDY